ncbi:C40 family peptidase [Eubacterium ramulus]|uniref:C40 family peptidase n=1 Tax=Eubacterium ramulus TaxID=39490 RepID=UPI00300F2248
MWQIILLLHQATKSTIQQVLIPEVPTVTVPLSGSSSDSGSASTGSGSGSAVVNYACQFVGNPYVWGGTSLTNGADCSGFIMSVYAHFGVSLPHSSSAMRGVGREVSVSDMQPGDIVCYSGHVAIYMGGGQIVHASSPSTGIKISGNVHYKTILTVRRIF